MLGLKCKVISIKQKYYFSITLYISWEPVWNPEMSLYVCENYMCKNKQGAIWTYMLNSVCDSLNWRKGWEDYFSLHHDRKWFSHRP